MGKKRRLFQAAFMKSRSMRTHCSPEEMKRAIAMEPLGGREEQGVEVKLPQEGLF